MVAIDNMSNLGEGAETNHPTQREKGEGYDGPTIDLCNIWTSPIQTNHLSLSSWFLLAYACFSLS